MRNITITGRLVKDAEMILAKERERVAITLVSSEGGDVAYYSCYGYPTAIFDSLKKGCTVLVVGALKTELSFRRDKVYINNLVNIQYLELLSDTPKINEGEWIKDFNSQ